MLLKNHPQVPSGLFDQNEDVSSSHGPLLKSGNNPQFEEHEVVSRKQKKRKIIQDKCNSTQGAIENSKKIKFQKITKGVANFSMPIVNRSNNETSKKEQASNREQDMGQKLERNICAYDDINQIFARIKVVERPQ